MFKVLGKIPSCHFHVAVSGGSDSMVLVDYLRRWPKNKFDILHFNHGTKYCDEAESFVKDFCNKHDIECHVSRLTGTKNKGQSQEDFWRIGRYEFLQKFKDEPILMAHHLNDCIETWVMTSMKGNPKLIPYHNKQYNIYRPFLCVPKSEINDWIKRHDISYVVDGSNYDTKLNRNYVRHVMMEHIYHINPGIEKSISNLIKKDFNARLAQW